MATIYVRKLEEKIPVETLKTQLREVFESYGSVLNIYAKRSLKKKGQAFIDFSSVEDAEKAINATNNTEICGSIVEVKRANANSDAIHLLLSGAPRKRKLSGSQSRAKKPKTENNILFLQGLAPTTQLQHLQEAYGAKMGFVEARIFAVKGVGFVEFDSIENASNALADIEIEGNRISVSYAAK